MSDSEQPTEKPAEVKDLTKAHARQMLIKQCVFVFLVSSICAAYLQLNPGYLPTGLGDNQTVFTWNRNEGLPEGDGYYHIKAAYLYRTGEMFEAGENFHWTRNSIWNGHFSDKEFLYHIYLVPFTLMAEDQYHWQAFVSGAKLSAVIAAGLFMLALFSTMRQLKVPKAWFWTLAAGAVMGVFLPTRLTEPRSWVFGVCFAMLGWAALTRNSRKWAFVIAALFVLSYTGSWLLLAMAFFRAGFRFVVGPDDGSRKAALKQDLILTGVVFGGLLLGWILHPGSFALLKIWWVQNIVVPYTHGFGTPTGIVRGITGWMLDWGPDAAIPRVPNEMLGGELKGVPITVLLMGNTFEVTMPVLLPCLSAWFRVRPSKTTVATFIIGVGFTVLHFYNGRFVEYAVPFLLLAGAKWMSEILAAR
ncbi:MAG: hypothetical protein KDB82_14745, partial [Planctomycetes bacterium]|nr:hypothetical protein [Planctomycetota bacterium]